MTIAAMLITTYLLWAAPSSTIDAKALLITQQRQQYINNSIISFVQTYKRLPCPASSTIRNDNTTPSGPPATLYHFATEALDIDNDGSDCNTTSGSIPTRTLGLSDNFMFDGWGHRFTYRVSPNLCGDDTHITTESIPERPYVGCTPRDYKNGIDPTAPNPNGNLTIKTSTTGSNITTTAAYVIISHGKNGAGAFLESGNQLAAPTDQNELENADGTTDLIYIDQPLSNTYDDIITFLTKNQITNLNRNHTKQLLTQTECQNNNNTLASITRPIASNLDSDINDYELSSAPLTTYNTGSSITLDLLLTLQDICAHSTYYTLARQCPGGGTLNGTQCSCNNGTWNNDC